MEENRDGLSEAAKKLSKFGASKGGKKRAENMAPEDRTVVAKAAAAARWGGVAKVKAIKQGTLNINGVSISCAVLEDGRRVLTQEDFLGAIGRARKAKAGTGSTQIIDRGEVENLPPFLAADNLKLFITKELRESTTPIVFRTVTGQRAFGYEAKLLPMVCKVYLEAREANVLAKSQYKIARACEVLLLGLAEVGIVALVDEATGHQYDRDRRALAQILEQFIAKELVKWSKMFPDDFYYEMYRLKNLRVQQNSTRRPRVIGKLTVDLVYRRLAPGVLEELKRLTPRDAKGRLKHKYFQRLTKDIGHDKLREHFLKVITLMQVSDDWDTFYRLIDKAMPKFKPMPLFDKADGVSVADSSFVAANEPGMIE